MPFRRGRDLFPDGLALFLAAVNLGHQLVGDILEFSVGQLLSACQSGDLLHDALEHRIIVYAVYVAKYLPVLHHGLALLEHQTPLLDGEVGDTERVSPLES